MTKSCNSCTVIDLPVPYSRGNEPDGSVLPIVVILVVEHPTGANFKRFAIRRDRRVAVLVSVLLVYGY